MIRLAVSVEGKTEEEFVERESLPDIFSRHAGFIASIQFYLAGREAATLGVATSRRNGS